MFTFGPQFSKIKEDSHTIALTLLKSILEWNLVYSHHCATISNSRTFSSYEKETLATTVSMEFLHWILHIHGIMKYVAFLSDFCQ